ncbi:MAG: RIP metalloprotease RseP [Bacteroidota bacterium]
MLTALSYFFWVAVALGILVFVHELGHFLFARLFGMRVDAFSLGFPPNIVSKKVGDTDYRIGAIPLGGYVKIAGMIDESMEMPYEMRPVLDADGQPVHDDKGRPEMEPVLGPDGKPVLAESSEPEPDEYRAKPVWQRILVITGGVVFNVIFAWMVYTGLNLTYGERSTPPENIPFEITPGSIAAEMGLETGDRIVALNGEPLARIEDLTPIALADENLQLTVLRGTDSVTVGGIEQPLTRFSRAQREAEESGEEVGLGTVLGMQALRPALITGISAGSAAEDAGLQPGDLVVSVEGEEIASWDAFTDRIVASGGETLPLSVEREGEIVQTEVTPRASGDSYVLGVMSDPASMGSRVADLGFVESMSRGVDQTVGMVTTYFGFVGKLVTGRESFRENVGGPLIIAKQAKEAADVGGFAFWNIVATLSIALAVFNILPIPVLDGGHLVFLIYEGIVRREPSLRFRIAVQKVGMIAILALMVFVIFNDAVRWFG